MAALWFRAFVAASGCHWTRISGARILRLHPMPPGAMGRRARSQWPSTRCPNNPFFSRRQRGRRAAAGARRYRFP